MKMEGETVYLIACVCNLPVTLLRIPGYFVLRTVA